MSKEDATPMDPSVREDAVGAPATHNPRPCYAAKTLAAEVDALFPETPVEFVGYNGRNVALAVSFDTTGSADGDMLVSLLGLLTSKSEPRVEEVIEEDGQVIVSFQSNPRTQDSREPFGLADAFDVLNAEAAS